MNKWMTPAGLTSFVKSDLPFFPTLVKDALSTPNCLCPTLLSHVRTVCLEKKSAFWPERVALDRLIHFWHRTPLEEERPCFLLSCWLFNKDSSVLSKSTCGLQPFLSRLMGGLISIGDTSFFCSQVSRSSQSESHQMEGWRSRHCLT